MAPDWLTIVAWTYLSICFACAAGIAYDIAFNRRRQPMGAMNAVYPDHRAVPRPVRARVLLAVGTGRRAASWCRRTDATRRAQEAMVGRDGDGG
jgi:hypothetical protein